MTVQNLPALIEWTHRSEPTSSPQSQNNYTVNQTVRNHSLNNIALIFWPAASVISRCACLSRQWDSEFDVFCSQARVTYKCKANKVQPVDQADLSRECSIHVINWKEKILKKRLALMLQQESNLDLYDHLITLKFSDIKWGVRMTSENVANLKIESQLTLTEWEILMTVLFNQESALSWHFSHLKRLQPEVVLSQKIQTISHKTWQISEFQVSRALKKELINMLKKWLDFDILEPCQGPYWNPCFLVQKSQKGKYHLINAVMHINKVTIKDVNISLNIEQFVKEFINLQAVSLVNMQSEYNQIELNKRSRNITGFMTVLDLLWHYTFIQEEINFVAQFCRAMVQILEDLISNVCCMFLNNIAVKGPQTDYNSEKVLMRVHWYILKTIQNLNKVLINIECTDRSVSDEKSQYIMKQLKIVEFVCRPNGRSSVINKVLKIVQWRPCQNLKEAHVFIDLCVYYWLWINQFAIISSSIYDLFKKNVAFLWMLKQQQTMNKLKILLSTELIIQQLDYDSDTKDIILTVNSSKKEWEFCLMQKAKNGQCCHVCQYDSGVWTNAESEYDAGKEWALTHATSATVSRFLWENVITRHDVFDKLICDKESENKMWVKMLTKLYEINQIVVSAYNSEANGMMKCEHKPLIDALFKMTAEELSKWSDLLTLILWADQTTIKRSTDWTSYEILYEYACILTIEARIPTWSTLAWKKVRTHSDLLMIWAEQLLHHDMNFEETAAQIQWTHQSSKEHINSVKHAVNWDYKVEDMVLLYNSRYKDDNTAAQKLEFWWLRLYKVIKANSKKENYVLAELNGVEKADTVSEFRLKSYVLCHLTANHEYNQCLDAYFESDSSDFNLDDNDAHEQIPTLLVKRQTQKADNDTAYASSDWPSVIKQTFLCNFLKYHNSFFSTVIHSSECNYQQSFFYLILEVFLHTSVRLTLLLWTQLISATWIINLFCHKHRHIMMSNSHMTSLLCERNFQKWEEEEQKSEFFNYHKRESEF